MSVEGLNEWGQFKLKQSNKDTRPQQHERKIWFEVEYRGYL